MFIKSKGLTVGLIVLSISWVLMSCKKVMTFNPDLGNPPGSSMPGEDDDNDDSGSDTNKTYNILDFGAVPDGKTLNTRAIQQALDSARLNNGGIVLVPEGTFLSGPLSMGGNTDLHIEKNGILKLNDTISSFPVKDDNYLNFIDAAHVSNIKITGDGTIDGQGEDWWEAFDAGELGPRRPQLIKMTQCSNITISGIHTLNPPNTHFSLDQCQNVIFDHVTITAPANSHNTDGINIAGQHILIQNCTIATGDDNIAFNVGHAPISDDLTVKNCTFGVGHGLSIGSYTSAGIQNLIVDSCAFSGTTAGIRIKSDRDRGGLVQNISYSNITMNDVQNPILITSYYPKTPSSPDNDIVRAVTATTPVYKDIKFENIKISNSPNSIILWGLPEMSIDNVSFNQIEVNAIQGVKIYYAKNVSFKDSEINNQNGDALTIYQAEVTGL